jgi:hypothetical protein
MSSPTPLLEFNMSLNKPLISLVATAVIALLGAGSAMAQDATPDYARAQTVTSSVTRADVVADTAAFRASGAISPWTSKFSNRTQVVANPQPRAVVKAETVRALQAHEVIDAGEVFSIRPTSPARVAGLAR